MYDISTQGCTPVKELVWVQVPLISYISMHLQSKQTKNKAIRQ